MCPEGPWQSLFRSAGPDHVTLQALITWLIKSRSRDWACTDPVAIIHWWRDCACTDDVAVRALITCLSGSDQWLTVADQGTVHALIGWLIRNWPPDCACSDHVAGRSLITCLSYGDHVTGQPTLVFLPEKSRGQMNLAGYSPWGNKESSDMTQRLNSNNQYVLIWCFNPVSQLSKPGIIKIFILYPLKLRFREKIPCSRLHSH